ncbi:hypothetical protein PVAP13_8NG202604 [Panicum virgatum]|uniref:Uncharacterized protein n=1 Tax=Panicum virgatum TaxID=38727 RepID=A0A8T0PBA8_PANVG|nr:hypothetical protein PVAP13_8NG202604 [Panicum virgatum]
MPIVVNCNLFFRLRDSELQLSCSGCLVLDSICCFVLSFPFPVRIVPKMVSSKKTFARRKVRLFHAFAVAAN